MRIRYFVRLKEPILIPDHWPIASMGGRFSLVREGEQVVGFEISFSGQSTDLSPVQLGPTNANAGSRPRIAVRDTLQPAVTMQLQRAFSFLQCYFDVEVLIDEVESHYEAETPEEEGKISLKGMKFGWHRKPSRVSYDFLTRALMAAENANAPEFEATLVRNARGLMFEDRYIDSFRYSFLLIESFYGNGKHKTKQLQQELRGNEQFRLIVSDALEDRTLPRIGHASETESLLACNPNVDDVIDHLVNQRGFYFHGNIKRRDAWKPHDQAAAESLCRFALDIALQIGHEASAPMFEVDLDRRHVEQAQQAGAIMTLQVNYRFQDPDEPNERRATMNISVPGTKVTARMAAYVARNFLEKCETEAPIAELKSATCVVKGSSDKVFDISINVPTTPKSGETAATDPSGST